MGMLRVRIPDELEKRLDNLVEKLQELNPATEVSRSSVVRYALEKVISEEESKLKEDDKMYTKEQFEKLWETVESPKFHVLDEYGYNFAEAMVCKLNEGIWLYVDNQDGFDVVKDEIVKTWSLVPEGQYVEPN